MILVALLAAALLSSCEHIRIGGGTSGGQGHDGHDHHHGHEPVQKKGGPPAHAPAHGYRKKFDYKYYPSKKVYYCSQRRLYFWIEGDGWKLGASLPSNLNVSGVDSISVDISQETPYMHYESNYKQSHPGKGKAKGKYKEKGKGKKK